jgi:hypothetical protein
MRQTIALAKESGYPPHHFTDPFIGACSLKLAMEEGDCQVYGRMVNFSTADSLVAWKDAGGLYHRRVFASRAHNIVAVELKRLDGSSFDLRVELARIDRDLDESFYSRVIAETARSVDPDFLSYRVSCRQETADQGLRGYCVGMRVVVQGGSSDVDASTLAITNADRVLLLIDCQPEFNERLVPPASLRDRLAALGTDYDMLLAEHVSLHSQLYNRVSLTLCPSAEEQVPTTAVAVGLGCG